jgi:hypothetical protein
MHAGVVAQQVEAFAGGSAAISTKPVAVTPAVRTDTLAAEASAVLQTTPIVAVTNAVMQASPAVAISVVIYFRLREPLHLLRRRIVANLDLRHAVSRTVVA